MNTDARAARSREETAKDALQLVGVFWIAFIITMILYRGYVMVSGLAERYSGAEFWVRLGRQVIANLAGG